MPRPLTEEPATTHNPAVGARLAASTRQSQPLRLECLQAGDCYVCATPMTRSSGGKWLCTACGFLLTCCDP